MQFFNVRSLFPGRFNRAFNSSILRGISLECVSIRARGPRTSTRRTAGSTFVLHIHSTRARHVPSSGAHYPIRFNVHIHETLVATDFTEVKGRGGMGEGGGSEERRRALMAAGRGGRKLSPVEEKTGARIAKAWARDGREGGWMVGNPVSHSDIHNMDPFGVIATRKPLVSMPSARETYLRPQQTCSSLLSFLAPPFSPPVQPDSLSLSLTPYSLSNLPS